MEKNLGIGNSVQTACGITMFSRHIVVSVWRDFDGKMITEDMARVTCKRCLAMRETKIRRLVAVQEAVPGVFDHPTLCGDNWLLEHGLDVKREVIDSQKLELVSETPFTLTNKIKTKDRKSIIRRFMEIQQG